VQQPDGKIYQFKVNEDVTIEHDCSLSAQLRDASAYFIQISALVWPLDPYSE
jgi:hypothetical protein